jgi:perosamine synthetase
VIPYGRHYIDEDDIEAGGRLLRTGLLTQGPAVEAFEQAVADYVGARYAVAVSSGTAALHIAGLAAGVEPGRDVVTSPITFVASANTAYYAGARAHFADIDESTVNMSPCTLEQVLHERRDIAAVIPVHFAGLVCDMPAIRQAADRADAVVIEDAAHALGSRNADGSPVGSCAHSLMTVFSFHPVKAIAAGEGGMVTTNDETVYRRLLRLRSHGINKLDDPLLLPTQASTGGLTNPWYYEMQELGFNYRITDIQCALALSQLRKLERFIRRRRELVDTYDAAFEAEPHISPAQVHGRDTSGHHLYVARIDFDAVGVSRAEVMLRLRERGIVTQVHYIPVPMHPFHRTQGAELAACPAAGAYYAQALSLPLYYGLTDEEQSFVVAALRESLDA